MAEQLDHINRLMFSVTDFNALDIHDVDIYTHLYFKSKNIMQINDILAGLQHEKYKLKHHNFYLLCVYMHAEGINVGYKGYNE